MLARSRIAQLHNYWGSPLCGMGTEALASPAERKTVAESTFGAFRCSPFACSGETESVLIRR